MMKICAIVLLLALVSVSRAQTPETGVCGSCCTTDCGACDRDCDYKWSDWSECSLPCGGGLQNRTRTYTVELNGNGMPCNDTQSPDVQYRPCNQFACPEGCDRPQFNVLFLLDRSYSQSNSDYRLAITQEILSLASYDVFDKRAHMDAEGFFANVRVAIATYNTAAPSLLTNFTDDTTTLANAVTGISKSGASRNTGQALSDAYDFFDTDNEARRNATNIVFLVVAGTSSDNAVASCIDVKRAGIRVIGAGVNSAYNDNSSPQSEELKAIVSSPLPQNYISARGSNDLFEQRSLTRRVIVDAGAVACASFGNGHINTFDGQTYTPNLRGDFFLLKSCGQASDSDLTAAVRMVPCGICPDLAQQEQEASSGQPVSPNAITGRTCARAYALQSGDVNLEFSWEPNSAFVDIKCNNNLEKRQAGPYSCTGSTASAGIVVTQLFLGGFEVLVQIDTASSTKHQAIFTFSHTESSIDAVILPAAVPSSEPEAGLCGYRDACPLNDFRPRNSTAGPIDVTASAGEIAVGFVDSWRMNYDENIFSDPYPGTEFNFAEWTPEFPDVTSSVDSYSEDFRSQCTSVINSNAYNRYCLSDTAANDNSAAIGETYRRHFRLGCDAYCNTGIPPTSFLAAAFAEDGPGVCDDICQFKFTRNYTVDYTRNIHTVQTSDALPTVDLRGVDLPGSFFNLHPNTPGGKYTFVREVQRPDLCADEQNEAVPSLTVDVDVACLPLPTVAAEKLKRVYYGSYGWPEIQLRGAISDAGEGTSFPGQKLYYSWKLLRVVQPDNTNSTAMLPEIQDSKSRIAHFVPLFRGVHVIEFAVTDGCGVSRDTIFVDVVERCCTPESATQPLNALLFQQQGVGVAWGSSSWTTNGSSITMPQLSDGNFDPTDEPFANAKAFRANPTDTDIQWTYEVVGRSATPGGDFVGIVSNNMSVTGRPDTTFLVIDVERNATVDQFNTTTEVGNTTNVTVAPTPSGNRLLQRLERLAPVVDIEADFTAGTTTTTTVSRKEVTRVTVPEVSTACEVSLNTLSQQTSRNTAPTQTVTVAVPSNVTGDTTYATRCTGFYKIRQTANVIGYSEFCAKDHDLVVEAACARAPVAQVSCPDAVEFDYMGAGFPDITLIGNGSYGFNANNYSDATTPVSISYLWQFVSAPEGVSIGPLPSCSTDAVCSFSPTVQGTYDATLTVTDGCSQDVVAFSVRASCGEPTNAVIQGDTTVTYTTPGVIGNPRGFLNASMSTSPGTLGFGWSIVGTPAGASVFRSVPAPTITATGRDATFNAFFAGVYTVRLEADDMCTSEAVNQSVTVTCASAVSTTALTDMTSTFAGGNFPDVTFMTTPSGGAGGSGPYTTTWYLLDADGNVTDTSVGTSVTVNSTRPEVRTVVVETTDGCNFATRSATITSTCGTNTQPKISGQTATPVSSPLRVNRPFFLNATVVDGNGVVTYEWTALRAGDETPIVLSTSLEPQDLTLALPGTYTLTLTATDECGQVTTATVPLTVVCFHTLAATARAYPTSVEYVNGRFPLISVDGNTSNIDGENKTDVSYTWTFLSAPALSTYFAGYVAEEPTSTVVETAPVTVTLANGTIVETFNVTTTDSQVFNLYGATLKQRASTIGDLFPACFHPDLPGTYELELTITDGCSTSTSTVSVTAGCPAAPGQSVTITPGAAVTINEEKDTIVYLDASASTTNSATDLDFSWVIVDEPLAPDTNESNHTATTLYNANRPVASFVPLWVGSYVFELTLDDGCTTSKQNYTVTVTQTCTVVTDVTPSTITAAYNYLAPVTQTFCLDAPFQTAADGATAATSTASDTHNTLYPDADGQDAMYPQYSEAYSGLYKGLTQLQCDNKYTWEIVDFEPQTTVVAKNPCDGNDDLIVCGGDGVNNALQSASTRATFSGAFVIALAAVAAVLGQ